MPKFQPITEKQLAATLAAKLRTLRGSDTAEQVADKAGVARRVYGLWETGKKLPSLRKLLPIANYHQMPVKELL